jgi:hypothetical protein
MEPVEIEVRAGAAIRNGAVVAELSGLAAGHYRAVDDAGQAWPAQVTALANGSALAGVYVAELGEGSAVRLRLEPEEAPAGGRGVDLQDQPESGRIVVNYSGFLQTIYHYGAENFKPRFYPITAPCARMGNFDDPHTVYPKSITDDSPPDHIWHRSLWYAAGEVFVGDAKEHVDFYLENGGEGRIVHKGFSDVFSGPVSGGFRESLVWRTPDGREILADERRFVLYRLKGTGRVFDIEATFTALDKPVTFGQTNENALPLIRVADVIDEWDGGKVTLSDGTTGGKDAFAKHAEWADCTGPLVRKPGLEPQYWGIAMLDHPSNRGHPNAWFARSYGPLGTNLPFFDGALRLAPGETWTLRNRIVVHEGGPEEAGIAARFAEYAKPGTIEVR